MRNSTNSARSGRRIVGWIFATALGIAVSFGYLIGNIIRNDVSASIGVLMFEFRPTPFNMAAYGGIAVLVILGIVYVLMELVSRRESEV